MDIDFHDPQTRRNAILIGVSAVLFIAAIGFFFLRGGEDSNVPAPIHETTQEIVKDLQSKQPPPAPQPEEPVIIGGGKGVKSGG